MNDESALSEELLRGEWLVTNGLGGYSSSTVLGIVTRKYHALLVAALPPPFGRTILLNHLLEEVVIGDKSYPLSCEEKREGELNLEALRYLRAFYLEDGLPVWQYEVEGVLLEKRIFMVYRENTVYISYKILSGAERVTLKLHPAIHFRPHEAPVQLPLEETYTITAMGEFYEIKGGNFPPLQMTIFGAHGSFILSGKYINNIFLRIESNRGYEAVGELWTSGHFQIDLKKGAEVGLLASSEPWHKIQALTYKSAKKAELERRYQLLNVAPPRAKEGMGSELVLAADQFIITPESRERDIVRAHAGGNDIRTVIAGYHWFTDWGRDTMISLEGLTLCTGRAQEARWILKTFADYVQEGLIPNMFPEGRHEGLYHTADASLWFFHAVGRYVATTGDRLTLKEILPTLNSIIAAHVHGTRFGIGMDPKDGLIKQGAEGYQLTWMDAKVGDWVVTPRRGKVVEINALWYNALKLMEEWMLFEKEIEPCHCFSSLAEQVYTSFNERFWIKDKGYLFDVIDGEQGDDSAFRPNQLFALSLPYPVLEESRWRSVVELCQEKLLTPLGLRTLSMDHPDFRTKYSGDLRSRDAAYHQGTVWAWLIGPYIDAWLRVHPGEVKAARALLERFSKHLSEAGIGSISEIFDAVEPYTPRGCMAQAWSVAEVLRCWLKTAE